MSGRWFRFYAKAMRDPKVLKLSDKDFRLWMNLLSIASENDGSLPCDEDLKLVLGMRLDHLKGGLNRLIRGGLIDPLGDGYEPHHWNKFQYKKDSDPSQKDGQFYTYFIGNEDRTKVKIGYSKNPWARLSSLQTGNAEKLAVLGTIKCAESGDKWLADLFVDCHHSAEWFTPNKKLLSLIDMVASEKGITDTKVISWLANYGSNTTITEADTEADTELPLSNDNGAAPDSDKEFWASAKSYLGGNKSGALIGRWCRDFGKAETAKAITAAQTERAVEPVPYITAVLKKQSAGSEVVVGI